MVSRTSHLKQSSERYLRCSLICTIDVFRRESFLRIGKEQRLVLLRKPKKPPDDPSSFRSLYVLDSGGKSWNASYIIE